MRALQLCLLTMHSWAALGCDCEGDPVSSVSWERLENVGDVPPPLFHGELAHIDRVVAHLFGVSQTTHPARQTDVRTVEVRGSTLHWQIQNTSDVVPPGRSGQASARIDRGVLVFGGNGGGTDVWLFAMDSDASPRFRWRNIAVLGPTPPSREHHQLTPTSFGSLLISGRFVEGEALTNEFWLFALINGTCGEWSMLTVVGDSFPARLHHTAQRMDNGDILVFGGRVADAQGGTSPDDSLFLLTLPNKTHVQVREVNTSSSLAAPGQTYHHCAGVGPDGSLIITSGRGPSGAWLRDTWRFTLTGETTGEWLLLNNSIDPDGRLPGRAGVACVVLPDGRMLVTGGAFDGEALGESYISTPLVEPCSAGREYTGTGCRSCEVGYYAHAGLNQCLPVLLPVEHHLMPNVTVESDQFGTGNITVEVPVMSDMYDLQDLRFIMAAAPSQSTLMVDASQVWMQAGENEWTLDFECQIGQDSSNCPLQEIISEAPQNSAVRNGVVGVQLIAEDVNGSTVTLLEWNFEVQFWVACHAGEQILDQSCMPCPDGYSLHEGLNQCQPSSDSVARNMPEVPVELRTDGFGAFRAQFLAPPLEDVSDRITLQFTVAIAVDELSARFDSACAAWLQSQAGWIGNAWMITMSYPIGLEDNPCELTQTVETDVVRFTGVFVIFLVGIDPVDGLMTSKGQWNTPIDFTVQCLDGQEYADGICRTCQSGWHALQGLNECHLTWDNVGAHVQEPGFNFTAADLTGMAASVAILLPSLPEVFGFHVLQLWLGVGESLEALTLTAGQLETLPATSLWSRPLPCGLGRNSSECPLQESIALGADYALRQGVAVVFLTVTLQDGRTLALKQWVHEIRFPIACLPGEGLVDGSCSPCPNKWSSEGGLDACMPILWDVNADIDEEPNVSWTLDQHGGMEISVAMPTFLFVFDIGLSFTIAIANTSESLNRTSPCATAMQPRLVMRLSYLRQRLLTDCGLDEDNFTGYVGIFVDLPVKMTNRTSLSRLWTEEFELAALLDSGDWELPEDDELTDDTGWLALVVVLPWLLICGLCIALCIALYMRSSMQRAVIKKQAELDDRSKEVAKEEEDLARRKKDWEKRMNEREAEVKKREAEAENDLERRKKELDERDARALEPTRVEPVLDDAGKAILQELLTVKGHEGDLRVGPDYARGGVPVPDFLYTMLTVRYAWKVHSGRQNALSTLRKDIVHKDLQLLREDRRTHLTHTALSNIEGLSNLMGLETRVNEQCLLHGIPASNLVSVIENGFDERLGGGMFGAASYFCENAAKMDQYVRLGVDPETLRTAAAGDPKAKSERHLMKMLFDDCGMEWPTQRVYFALACAVTLGCPVHTEDKHHAVATPGVAPLARAAGVPCLAPSEKLLNFVPEVLAEGGEFPLGKGFQFHSLIGEVTPHKLVRRFREFAIYNGSQARPVILIAFTRDP